MAKTFDHSLDEIVRLVKHYRTNRAAFHAPGYKEAHARSTRRTNRSTRWCTSWTD